MESVKRRILFPAKGVNRPRFWSAEIKSRNTKVVNVYIVISIIPG